MAEGACLESAWGQLLCGCKSHVTAKQGLLTGVVLVADPRELALRHPGSSNYVVHTKTPARREAGRALCASMPQNEGSSLYPSAASLVHGSPFPAWLARLALVTFAEALRRLTPTSSASSS